MMRTGVTIRACQQAFGLLGLAVVRAKAASPATDDLAVSAANLIREACASVDDISSGPSAVLLGIAPGFRSMPPKDRRAHVANEAVLSIDHIRKYREPQLLEAVADELYAMDSAYRLRHRHRTEAERSPRDSALKIDWLEQHRSYRRVWTPVTAMRNDVIVLAGLLADAQAAGRLPRTADALAEHGPDSDLLLDRDDWHPISDRCSTLCWQLAIFRRELNAFVEREGGLWLLASAEAEIAAADAMFRLRLHGPFGEVDESVLGVLLESVVGQELDPFEEALLSDKKRWPIFRDSWVAWVQRAVDEGLLGGSESAAALLREPEDPQSRTGLTRSTTTVPNSECGRWLRAGEDFIELIDEDWYRVADWYRESTPYTLVPLGSPASRRPSTS